MNRSVTTLLRNTANRTTTFRYRSYDQFRVMMSTDSHSEALIYVLRKDLRLEDNPIFHYLANNPGHNFRYLLPVYIFPADQIEVSGFIPFESKEKSPYPEARSRLGKYWKCGPHRAKFLGETVWALKETLQDVGSDLEIRVGGMGESIEAILNDFKNAELDTTDEHKPIVSAVWMTDDEGPEERDQEKEVQTVCEKHGVSFKLWKDEKYLIDDDDVAKLIETPDKLPDIFTTYRKMVEPLRDNVRDCLPTPKHLPALPPAEAIGKQPAPFAIPDDYSKLEEALLLPIQLDSILADPPARPQQMVSAHPFHGGAKNAHDRVNTLLTNGAMAKYHDTRNGLLGLDFSTKLSAYLALGCITARTVHAMMYDFEEGKSTDEKMVAAEGFGKGENEGTKGVRFELAWRDYMRLCTRKFPDRLLSLGGFKADFSYPWNKPAEDEVAKRKLERFLNGTSGIGLIDASMRELYHTGYTSNRARQNVASFLAKHLDIDWRYGAEWYESMLVDYDVNSNWGNWQYVAGVGNDPRGDRGRVFNPIKQAHDYDGKGEYIYHWIPEFQADKDGKPTALVVSEKTRGSKRPESQPTGMVDVTPNDVFRGYLIPKEKQARLGIDKLEWITDPVERVQFWPNHNARGKKGKFRNAADKKDGGDKGGRSGSGSASPTKGGSSPPGEAGGNGSAARRGSSGSRIASRDPSPGTLKRKDEIDLALRGGRTAQSDRVPPLARPGGWGYQAPFGNNQSHNTAPYRNSSAKTTRYPSNNSGYQQRLSADFGRRSSAGNPNMAYQMHLSPPPGLGMNPQQCVTQQQQQQVWGMGMGMQQQQSAPQYVQHHQQQQHNQMMGWGAMGTMAGMGGNMNTMHQGHSQTPAQHRWGNGAVERMPSGPQGAQMAWGEHGHQQAAQQGAMAWGGHGHA